MIELDASTKDEIARLMAGDEDRRLRRTEKQLREFFQRAGIEDVPDDDRPTRLLLARRALDGSNDGVSNAERAILRLADPREYSSDKAAYEESMRQLGGILNIEGLRIVHDERNRPAITPLELSLEPETALGDVELKVSLDQVISNSDLEAVAQERLNEARSCHSAGAYMSSIIMLGSLLEGVLIAAVQERPHGQLPKPIEMMGLQDLINFAHKQRWIQFDAQLGSQLVRQYRNLVHPGLQLREIGHLPDADTLDMCWPVVNAILNDLAATAPNKPQRPK
jgi:hypothetical protein